MDTPLAQEQSPAEPPPSECWCCGSITCPDRMVHLGNHPEVGICRPCARWAAKQATEIEDRDRTGPLVLGRDGLRTVRRFVIARGWHRSRSVGGALRWIGKRMP